MEYRNLGKSGLRLSLLSFGSWVTFKNQLNQTLASRLLSLAYEAGVNFFDNAEVYANGKSEELMGKCFRMLKWKRDSFCVSSKVFWGGPLPTQEGLHRKHVFEACHGTLKRLKVDYLDLYYCHRPDPHTPVEETVRAMNTLIQQGKILYWGTSEWPAPLIEEAHCFAKENLLIPPSMEQPQYNLFWRDRVEKEYASLYSKYGMGLTTWSPLAGGILSGKYEKGIPRKSRATISSLSWFKNDIASPQGQNKIQKTCKLSELAKSLGATTAQLAIAWCTLHPQVSSVILGATSEKQLKENLKSIHLLQTLNKEVVQSIEKMFRE